MTAWRASRSIRRARPPARRSPGAPSSFTTLPARRPWGIASSPLTPPRPATYNLTLTYKPPEAMWMVVGLGVTTSVAPYVSMAERWSASSTEVVGSLEIVSDAIGLGVYMGVRGRGLVLGNTIWMRPFPASPVSLTLGTRTALVTGSPELKAYYLFAAPVGVDVMPKGLVRLQLGVAPEVDISFSRGGRVAGADLRHAPAALGAARLVAGVADRPPRPYDMGTPRESAPLEGAEMEKAEAL